MLVTCPYDLLSLITAAIDEIDILSTESDVIKRATLCIVTICIPEKTYFVTLFLINDNTGKPSIGEDNTV